MTTANASDGAIALTVRQVAALMQLSEDTIYRHISSGELKSFDGSGRSTVRL